MSEQILSQTEIDALLSAVNEGEIEETPDGESSASSGSADGPDAVRYDLFSQDRIIRGRMPTLDIINDRFARQLRITLSNRLRKIVQISVESTSLMKYGEFLNYLPIPSCLNICRLHPLRGSCVISIEAKLIFAFLNNFFGGATNAQERVEGRDFTAIELMIIRKVVNLLLADLKLAWQPVYPVEGDYVRTEINPQFLAIVPATDVVVLTSFELEMDSLQGTVQVVIPYSTIEPIRHLLSNAAQSETEQSASSWRDHISVQLREIPVEGKVFLGTAQLTIRELLRLVEGDVLTLDQSQSDPLVLQIERKPKYLVEPVVKSGHLAARVRAPFVSPTEQAWLANRDANDARALAQAPAAE